MRSKRTDRKTLKAEIDTLRRELNTRTESFKAELAPQSPPTVEPPRIAANGYPLRAPATRPKSLKEAKEILMSMRDW